MFQVTVKGESVEHLRSAISNLYSGLCSEDVKVYKKIEVKTDFDEPVPLTQSLEVPEKETLTLPNGTEAPKDEYYGDPKDIKGYSDSTSLDLDLDTLGIPWDKRIHAASKGKVKDGSWRLKRSMDEAVVAEVIAELKQTVQQQLNPVEIPAAPINEATPVVAPVVEEVITETEHPPVIAVASPVAPPQPNMGQGHNLDTFITNFPIILGSLISEGKITNDYLAQLREHFKVDQIWNLNDAQKAEMFESFVSFGFIGKVG